MGSGKQDLGGDIKRKKKTLQDPTDGLDWETTVVQTMEFGHTLALL